jgi:hypothetical protein
MADEKSSEPRRTSRGPVIVRPKAPSRRDEDVLRQSKGGKR